MPKSFCLTCGSAYEYVGQKPNFAPTCGHAQTAFASQPPPPQYQPAPQQPQYQPVAQPYPNYLPQYGYQPQPQYGYSYQEPIPREAIAIEIAPRSETVVDLGHVVGTGPSNLGGPNRRNAMNKKDFKNLLKKMEPGTGRDHVIEVAKD